MTKPAILTVFLALSFSTAAYAAGSDHPAAPPSGTPLFAAQASTAAASGAQQTPLYEQEILGSIKHLSALLTGSYRVDRQELDDVAAELIKLDARVKNLLGPALLQEIEDREKERRLKAVIAAAKETLASARSAIMLYYGDLEGKYPASPAELIPAYLPAMPELELPGHAKTAAVELTDAAGPDISKAVTDTGGWLYFTNTKSPNFGMLILNCSHKDDAGTEFYKY